MFEIIILILIGLLTGFITGFIGLSSVLVSVPLLILLDFNTYQAIGMALLIDVFSSLTSTIYYKSKNKVDIKIALMILKFALLGVIVGSFFSKLISNPILTILIGISILFFGYDLIKSKKSNQDSFVSYFLSKINLKKELLSYLSYLFIGLNAGLFGAGGGLIILLVLINLNGLEIHKAVGTSVLAMTFIALFGGVSHYINEPFSLSILIIPIIFSIIGSLISSIYANRLNEIKLKMVAGVIIFCLGIIIFIKQIMNFL
jgi:uncharacterized protein